MAVFPENQGKGIGNKLIAGLTNYAAVNGHLKLGLQVNQNNLAARKFYISLGFNVADVRTFMGDSYDHLQFELQPFMPSAIRG